MESPARRGRQITVLQASGLLVAFVVTAVVGGLLLAGLTLPGVAMAASGTKVASTVFDELPSELAQQTLAEKSTMLAADGTVLAEFYLENRVVVPLDQVAPVMRDAVVATEDRRFYEHGGIDPAGLARAAVRSASGDLQGGSTLTQQYIKNVLIDAAQRADDPAAALQAARASNGVEGYARKLREAKLAISLEKTMTKDQILEAYLNIAQFGIGTYGVETAAQRYFGKHAADLTYLEAATIAGITQSPGKWDPTRNPEESQNRRDVVLGLMHEQGYITDEEYATGRATPLPSTLHVQQPKVTCMAADDAVPGAGFFCDYVTKIIANDPVFGATPQDRGNLLMRGGLTIHTTLDPRLQTTADARVKAAVPVDDPSGVAAAIDVVEPGTGKVLAMSQNRTYNGTQQHGPRETAVNYSTDNAYGGASGFQPGSTFKPFTLVEWLKQGHSLNETIDGRKMQYPMSAFTASCWNIGGGTYPFSNSEGSGGVMSVLDATRNSVNSAYIAMATKLDLCNIMNGAADLGVHKAGGRSGDGPFDPVPGNVLGSNSVAPLTMAAAFATFASGGTYCAPVAITSVTDADGNPLPVPEAGCHQALEPKIANAVNFALSKVWTGTAKSVGAPPFPAAGKTGTTTLNEDTWFVGYTPRLATAVWVGHSEGTIPMRAVTINGRTYRAVYGSDIAAPIWKGFMTDALAGQDNPGFAAPDDTQLYGAKIPVPSVVGAPLDQATATLQAAGFAVTVAPDQVASTVPAGAVADQSPSGSAYRGAVVTLTVSSGAPPTGSPPPQTTGPQGP